MTFKLYSEGREVSDLVLLKQFASEEEIEIFESLRTYRHQIFRLEEHVKRFMESARTAGFDRAIEPAEVKKNLQLALKSFIQTEKPKLKEEFFLRVTWMSNAEKTLNFRDHVIASEAKQSGFSARGGSLLRRTTQIASSSRQGGTPRNDGKHGQFPGDKPKLFVMIGRRKHSAALYKEGVALQTTVVKRSPSAASPAQAKTSDYMNALMATLDPKPVGVYEWLFLDRFGFVTEVRIGNIFMVKDGILATPPTTGILNGVTRRFVIECAFALGIQVREIPLTRHEIYNADEAFLTNTSWEILPVRQLDGRRIGRKIPGPISQKLQKTFKQRILQECQ